MPKNVCCRCKCRGRLPFPRAPAVNLEETKKRRVAVVAAVVRRKKEEKIHFTENLDKKPGQRTFCPLLREKHGSPTQPQKVISSRVLKQTVKEKRRENKVNRGSVRRRSGQLPL